MSVTAAEPTASTPAQAGRDAEQDRPPPSRRAIAMTLAPGPLSNADRAAVQRRVLRALRTGQITGAAALAAAVTVGAFVVQDILGEQTPWGGLAAATLTTGSAFMSQALSRLMRRRGRRPGLQLGYGLAAAGGLIAAAGAERQWLAGFLAGMFLFGTGQASNLLARYAATDLAEPDQRSRAMSQIVFASTFGAVLGPLLTAPARSVGAAWLGMRPYTGPWLFASVVFLLAMVTTAVRLRPDPLVVAGGIVPPGQREDREDLGRPTRRILASSPQARLALAAMAISQATMVAVMTMTPVHMRLHGHEALSPYVISTHIAGMYAFSPLIGRFADRRGRLPAILTGAGVLVVAAVLAALAGDVQWLLFPALWALGLGWNFGLIGGSALLSESVPASERVRMQGTADLTMSLCGALAGFSSGFIRGALGYHMLANLAAISAGALFVAAYFATQTRRHPQPAHAA